MGKALLIEFTLFFYLFVSLRRPHMQCVRYPVVYFVDILISCPDIICRYVIESRRYVNATILCTDPQSKLAQLN